LRFRLRQCTSIKRKLALAEKIFWSREVPLKTGFTVYIRLVITLLCSDRHAFPYVFFEHFGMENINFNP
jgi:hypothetical protein